MTNNSEILTDELIDFVLKESYIPNYKLTPNACLIHDLGMVGDDGILEIKCPMGSTHTETLMTQDIPSKYVPQVQFQLLVTGRKWCDFVSYHPMFPKHLQIFVKRIEADPVYQQELEVEVKQFLKEVDDVINKLKEIK